jgi:hypothetical protein
MKKNLLYLFIIIWSISCSDDIKYNNPAFEGQKDNVLWKAVDSKASLVGGVLTIEGYLRNEKLTIVVPAPTTKVSISDKSSYQTFILGTNQAQTATYYVASENNPTSIFATGLGLGNGQVEITQYDGLNKTVSGTFKFNAELISTTAVKNRTVNFKYGNFFMVLK